MRLRLAFLVLLASLLQPAFGAKISDVRATKHNFSATAVGRTTLQAPTRNVKAGSETQVCVFCHTPHGATAEQRTPLWNRQLSGQTYTPYTSRTLDAEVLQGVLDQPNGSSKLCLSCHDGSLAIGNVNVLGGKKSQTIALTGTELDGSMPVGSGATSGFTRRLGVDLTNDHPISVTFNTALADRDGELRPVDANQKWPADGSILGVRSGGYKPELPLEATAGDGSGQIQCATCHDPHMYDPDEATKGPQKFLRQNRFQEAAPSNTHVPATDIICLSCHDKNKGSGSWAFSVHAHKTVADETYKSGPAAQREFPADQPVWKAACLNCHDTHTVQGSRRLLREGTDSTLSPKTGGNPALEETCFQCHTTSAASVIASGNDLVPNIQSDFNLGRHMPIKSIDQAAGEERHEIDANFSDAGFIDCTGNAQCGKDFVEPRSKLGYLALENRHAECTDCHNPHRIIRAANGLPGALTSANTSTDTRATHNHSATHTNIISGALRGAWGVEPVYGGGSFFSLPTGYDVKRGDPGTSTNTAASATHVTREYQICLKCHSDYGYDDDNVYPSGDKRPELGGTGLTGANTNDRKNFTRYTNQAREFQPNDATADTGADAAYRTNNKRSWHPVVGPTNRPLSGTGGRGITGTNPWLAPWTAVGTQTMYCSDCHGTGTGSQTVAPTGSNPWGPHGSGNDFILKGVWGPGMGGTGRDSGETSNLLCFKCHNSAAYTTRNDSGRRSGFYNSSKGNLHNYHVDKIGKIYCTWCHVAVPHGWKNKMLLVNLNDVGAEAGQTGSKEVATNGSNANYSEGPYYSRAKNKITSFAASGSWSASNCGSAGKTTDRIANSQGGTTNTTGSGINWMKDTCSNPP